MATITPEQLAERIQVEVKTLVSNGVIPADVASFSALHDHVDANVLGGTEALWDALPVLPDGEVDGDARDALCDLMNGAHGIVDGWIKGGALGR